MAFEKIITGAEMKIGNVGCELLGNAAVFTMSLQGAAGELILVDVKVSDA